jgi:hypothetical protein
MASLINKNQQQRSQNYSRFRESSLSRFISSMPHYSQLIPPSLPPPPPPPLISSKLIKPYRNVAKKWNQNQQKSNQNIRASSLDFSFSDLDQDDSSNDFRNNEEEEEEEEEEDDFDYNKIKKMSQYNNKISLLALGNHDESSNYNNKIEDRSRYSTSSTSSTNSVKSSTCSTSSSSYCLEKNTTFNSSPNIIETTQKSLFKRITINVPKMINKNEKNQEISNKNIKLTLNTSNKMNKQRSLSSPHSQNVDKDSLSKHHVNIRIRIQASPAPQLKNEIKNDNKVSFFRNQNKSIEPLKFEPENNKSQSERCLLKAIQINSNNGQAQTQSQRFRVQIRPDKSMFMLPLPTKTTTTTTTGTNNFKSNSCEFLSDNKNDSKSNYSSSSILI